MPALDDRDSILSRVRGALAPLRERAALPDYDTEIAVMRKLVAGRDLVELLAERTKRVNGLTFTTPAALVAYLRAAGHLRGYCDPVLLLPLAPYFDPEFRLETNFDRTRVDDYSFGVTRAAGAIAETGTIILNDATTSRRLAALAPWVHVAVLSRSQIYADLPEAVSALGRDPNVVWCTGPSKTADVEGILIEGVHGPGQQIALVLD
jgi:L-lactate dehydrogenase complex protein LldG